MLLSPALHCFESNGFDLPLHPLVIPRMRLPCVAVVERPFVPTDKHVGPVVRYLLVTAKEHRSTAVIAIAIRTPVLRNNFRVGDELAK
jgi:hypothetical protein